MSDRFRDMFSDWQDDEGPPDEFEELGHIEPHRLDEKEVRVVGVYEHQETGMPPQYFVLLQDNRGRRVPIWIGKSRRFPSPWRWKGMCPTVP